MEHKTFRTEFGRGGDNVSTLSFLKTGSWTAAQEERGRQSPRPF